MKISIIVPVYNMAADGKLNFCLDSLVNQTIDNYEIIAVDDASTDNSLEILEQYKEKYPEKFRVYSYPDNRHQGGARNEGLRHAFGDWIAFIDSDDWVSPDYYEKLVEKGEETGADMVGSHYTITNEHSFVVNKVCQSNTPDQTGEIDTEKRKLLILNPASMVMKIYKREMIYKNSLSFPEHIFYEDNGAAPIWMMYVKHFELVDGPLYYYYMRSDSTIHTVTKERSIDRLTSMEIMLSECRRRGFYEEYKEEIEAAFIRLYYSNTLFGYMIACKKTELSFVEKIKTGMLTYFPNFTSNKYYASIPDEEQKRMTTLLIKNTRTFYVYYRLLWKYRHLRKKLKL